ncbi:hypothetical protein NUSPORA_00488 [Nucleospora cyclopteri]
MTSTFSDTQLTNNFSTTSFFTVTTIDNFSYTLTSNDLFKSEYLYSLYKIGGDDCFSINIKSDIFLLVLDFMQKKQIKLHKGYSTSEIFFPRAHLEWVKEKDSEQILELCNACNYLEYAYLMELCCKALADELMGLKDEEVETFCL